MTKTEINGLLLSQAEALSWTLKEIDKMQSQLRFMEMAIANAEEQILAIVRDKNYGKSIYDIKADIEDE